MSADPIGNNSRIEGSFNLEAKQHADMNALMKEASKLAMNSPLDSSSTKHEFSEGTVSGGTFVEATSHALSQGLNADISVLKKFNHVIGYS